MDKNFSSVWEGVFSEFPESDSAPIWNSERWVTSAFRSVPAPDRDACLKAATLSSLSLVHEYPLPPVIAMLARFRNNSPVKVLDFGGGGGNSFLSCVSSVPDTRSIEYHIVEEKSICLKGRELYCDLKKVFFHETFPEDIKHFDVVHVAAALHYVCDWRALLQKLLNYRPEVLMLNALNAGHIKKTFASYQNYYGEKIPVWFWRVDEILEYLSLWGYELIYKSLLEFPFLGKVQPLPMDNFPPELRLERKCNLMFMPKNRT